MKNPSVNEAKTINTHAKQGNTMRTKPKPQTSAKTNQPNRQNHEQTSRNNGQTRKEQANQ